VLALEPTPIGVGPRYQPKPAMHAQCSSAQAIGRVHVEFFANGRVIIIPTRIGVRSAGCKARLYTLDPTGVVHFARRARLGELFRIWGRTLTPVRLLSFNGRVRLYVNGVRKRVDPRTLALHDGDEIVCEVGPYIPPHRSYRFPRSH
jgi:hypothetical protein